MGDFLALPEFVQVALVVAGLLLAWLTARFGWRGLLLGAGGALAAFAVLALGASFLVSRLEGGTAEASDMVPGALYATLRLAVIWAPFALCAAVVGGAIRAWRARRPPAA